VLTFEEMLEMSASGAGVLQLRAVEYARNHGVTIHCRSSFDDGPGTVVQDEEKTMEKPLVTAITHSTAEARITLKDVPDRPGIAGRVLTALAEANINVDMIIQNEPQTDGHMAELSMTVPRDDVSLARSSLDGLRAELGLGEIQSDDHMGKVSVVGAGMKSHPGVAAKTFTVLGDAGVNIEMISTSPIKISCVVREEHVETAVRGLHTAFGLGADSVLPEHVAGVHRPKVA
jgi:aspartate kinase